MSDAKFPTFKYSVDLLPPADSLNLTKAAGYHYDILVSLLRELSVEGEMSNWRLQNSIDSANELIEHSEMQDDWELVDYDAMYYEALQGASVELKRSNCNRSMKWIPKWAAQAVALWEKTNYADLPLRKFLLKVRSDKPASPRGPDTQAKKASTYKKKYALPKTKGDTRRQRRGDTDYDVEFLRKREYKKR